MEYHDLIPNTPEWLAYRRTKHNASDAPAMMGVSPHKTRDELIKELATSLTADVSSFVQERIFDPGHQFEALFRPHAEKIIGKELYPVTGSEGKLSASFDGLSMDEEDAFEHKRLNANLRDIMEIGCTGVDLPMLYQVQMEQQCMVSGCRRVLFAASDWSEGAQLGDNPRESYHCWYTPNPELAAQISAGWDQLERDVCAYKPAEVVVEVVGRAPAALPALLAEVNGDIVVQSNLDQFKTLLAEQLACIPSQLSTDQDFADAAVTVTWCTDIETKIKGAKEYALSKAANLDRMFKAMDEIDAMVSTKRIALGKLITAEKEANKERIALKAKAELQEHLIALQQRIGPRVKLPAFPADFGATMKSKRSIDSMRNGVNTLLAQTKIDSNAVADLIQANLTALDAKGGDKLPALFPDLQTLAQKPADDFAAQVDLRIERHNAAEKIRLEAERERIRAEEVARIERENKERADALAREEAAARAQFEAAAVAAAAAEASATEAKPEPAPAPPAPPAAAPISFARSAVAATVATAEAAAAPPPPDEPATLKLGDINDRLGIDMKVTAATLSSLGFEHSVRDRSARLYRESQFPAICTALIKHITKVRDSAAKTA